MLASGPVRSGEEGALTVVACAEEDAAHGARDVVEGRRVAVAEYCWEDFDGEEHDGDVDCIESERGVRGRCNETYR